MKKAKRRRKRLPPMPHSEGLVRHAEECGIAPSTLWYELRLEEIGNVTSREWGEYIQIKERQQRDHKH